MRIASDAGAASVDAHRPRGTRPRQDRGAVRRGDARAAAEPARPASPRPVLGASLTTSGQARAMAAATADLVTLDGPTALSAQANVVAGRVLDLTRD